MLVDGSRASAPNPDARSMAPPAIAAQGVTVRASGRTASVASGTAVTTPAAAIGSRLQSATSMSTPRKSAPTRAPKTSPSAAFAASAGRLDGRAGSAGTSRRCVPTVARSARPASGAWTTKIARQSNAWVSRPPSAGPTAAPSAPAAVHHAAPLAPEPVSAASSGSEPASSSAPPRPCAARHATRRHVEASSERAADARRKEHPKPGPGQEHRRQPPHERHDGERSHGDDDVVGGDHPRDSLDRRVQLPVEVRKRENDDRRVRERQRHRDRDREREQAPAGYERSHSRRA